MALIAGGTTLSAGAAAAAEPQLAAAGLRTDSLLNPLGIGEGDPDFTWQLSAVERATLQTAYRVIVSSTRANAQAGTGDVWDSTWVDSERSVDVAYDGPALDSTTAYYWRVAVRDNHGNESELSPVASFETAKFDVAEWDADWIGEDAEAALNQWTDYSFEISASSIQGALGIYLRSSASAQNAYMWQISSASNSAAIRPHVRTNGGYNTPPNVTINPAFLNGALTSTTPNTFRFDVVGTTVTTFVNGNQVDTRTVSNFARGYVGFRSSLGESGTVHRAKVTTIGANPKVLLDTSFPLGDTTFTGGSQTVAGSRVYAVNDGLINGLDTEPIFRSEFTAQPNIASARLYASALGVYEFRLNGERVGDLELAPGWTDYNTRVAYQTYDVTDLVQAGENAIGALTGAGWYSGSLAWFGPNQYGTDSKLFGQLEITYDDGSTQVVGTDSDWKTTKGPILSSDLLMGETYNANLWQSGWDEPGFDDTNWNSILNAGSLATSKLEPQPEPPVRITQELEAKSVTNVGGKWVFDFGQNMVGKVRLTTGGNNGQTMTLKHAEILHADGSIAQENLRSAKATDLFTPVAGGGAQTYEPRFTYHGFRYVELTGFVGTPTTATLTGLVEGSDNEASSTFDTSSAMLNKLQSNIIWGQRGNFFSVPTDTPARDERLGWTGDINVFAPTAAFNMYSEEFLRKWMTDMRDAQHANGAYPEVAPQFCTNKAIHSSCDAGSTGWADAGVTVPFVVWQNYGDTGIISENWESMVDYIDYLDTQATGNIRPGYGNWSDWLNLNDPTPGNVLGTAFYANSVNLMAQMAAATGKTAEAAAYATQFDAIRAAYQSAFIAADGSITGGSQTAYAISIGMGLVPANLVEAAGEKLAGRVAAKGGHLSTGFLGTPYLLPALSQSGQQDVAYDLMMSETAPSWGYEVAMGATTMWEKWDSLGANGQPTDYGMNSFNHYAFGAVGDWMYQTIGGIRSTEAGFKHTLIAPKPGGGLTHAAVSHDSVYGTVGSDWTLANGKLSLAVEVPANTTSTVRIPARNVHELLEGGTAASEADGISSVTMDGSDAVVELGSGEYAFTIDELAGSFGAISDGLDAVQDALDGAGLSSQELAIATGFLADARAALPVAASAETEVDAARALHTALARLTSLATLLGTLDVESADGQIAAATAELSALSAQFLGISANVAVDPASVAPGGSTTATVTVTNGGDADLPSVSTALTAPAGWKVLEAGALDSAPLGAEEDRENAYTVRAPAAGALSATALDATVSYSFNGATAMITAAGSVAVASPVTLTSSASPTVVPGGSVVASVTLANSSSSAVRGTIQSGSTAWRVASGAPVTVPANGSIVVPVTLLASETISGGATSIGLKFVVGGVNWASLALPATVTLSLDGPAVTQHDHVDVGLEASELAHAGTWSSGSQRGSEAGVTRRYTGLTDPNGFMQFTLAVPEGEPFTLRLTETYDQNQTKAYNVKVNGQQVLARSNQRTTGGGTVTYSIPVLDTSLSATGSVVVRIENKNPLVANTYDPSIADIWTTSYTDYIDLGSTGSESAHNLTASAQSGITPDEAGRTRRYANRLDPTGYFQFQAKIVVGQPFTIQTVETYNGAQRKVYDVSVNGTVVQRRDFERTASGVGLATYQILVDDPALLSNGTVTIRFQSEPSGAYYDPSLSDVWVTPASADTQAPSLSPTVTGTAGFGGWYTSPVSIDATASDNRSGAVTVEERIGEGDWAAHSAPLQLSDDGTTVVALRATDAAGNDGATDELTVAIDQTAPSLEVTNESTGLEKETVTIDASDATSGVASVSYRIGTAAWTAYDAPFELAEVGVHRIQALVEDEAGNSSTSTTYVSVDDVTAPVVTLETSAAPVNGWIALGTTVTLAATDATGVASIEYRRAGSDWQTYSAPFALAAGKYTISYRATDDLGTTSAVATKQVWVDGTAPVTTPHVAANPGNRDRFDVGFTVTDAESGVGSTRYRLDGGDWDTVDGTVTVQGYGSHTIEFYSVDAVDNTEFAKAVTVSIKDVDVLVNYTAPVISGTVVVGGTLTVSNGTWNTSGLDYEYEWQRNGVAIPNATGSSYVVTTADVGKKLGVVLVASKPTLLGVAVTTAATVAVPKIVTDAVITSSKATVAKNGSFILTVTVTAATGTPTGSVAIYSGSTKLKTVTLVNGTATYKWKSSKAGTKKIKAVYAGTSIFAKDTSSTISVKVK
jgi:hypothetical protein